MLRLTLSIDVPKDIELLALTFKKAKHKLFLVGGAVRDALMGTKPKDFDLATDATPDEVVEFLSQEGYKLIEVGKSFGVVKALTSMGEYEIATFRRDIGSGRRPDSVVFTTIDEDVKRRDLTINALFFDLDTHEVVDLVGGLADIDERIIRMVGDPHERLDEDRLRVMRVLRFASRYGWKIDDAAIEALKAVNLQGVSPERIRDELLKAISGAKRVDELFSLIDQFGLWKEILLGLNVSTTMIEGLNNRCVPALLATLLDANDHVLVEKRLHELKYMSDEVAQVGFLLRFKELNVSNAYRLKKWFNTSGLTNEDLLDYVSLRGLPSFRLYTAFLCYDTAIGGDQLLDEGFRGKSIGVELERRETLRFEVQLRGSPSMSDALSEMLGYNRYGKEGEEDNGDGDG